METGFFPFVDAVNARLSALGECSLLHPEQRVLIGAQLRRMRSLCAVGGHAQPLGLLYWVLRAWRRECTEQAIWLGAFGALCMCSIDLFDDVQDDDLEGKPCEHVGPAIATNTALALMFLAIEALRQAQELEQRPELQSEYAKVWSRISLVGVACQHQDLMGPRGAKTPNEVMDRDSGKTAIVTLFLECGALLAGCEPQVVAGYRRVGGKLAALVQIVDDLRDVFGKTKSPDLVTGKLTYPLACFQKEANSEQRERFQMLVGELPESLPQIAELLYASGAVERCAVTVEQLRHEIHAELSTMNNSHGAQRVLLRIVDDLAQSIYAAENLEAHNGHWHPRGPFAIRLADARAEFERQAAAWACPPLPALLPWQQAHFYSQPELGICFFPDVDDLPEEVLGSHGLMLGESEPRVVAAALNRDAEFFVAHEMFHCWRACAELVNSDHWHEEYVCDRLALSYLMQFYPQAVDGLLQRAGEIVLRHEALISAECRDLVHSAREPQCARECDLDHFQTALWHALAVLQMSTHVGDFPTEMRRWLGAIEERQTAA